jgi:hypothetical protein
MTSGVVRAKAIVVDHLWKAEQPVVENHRPRYIFHVQRRFDNAFHARCCH